MIDTKIIYFLDHYCERINFGLLGEPFNLISNIGFFLAAYFLQRVYLKQRQHATARKFDIEWLILLMYSIGIGSSLWHSFATESTLWADRIPILLFINLYLLSCLFRIFNYNLRSSIAIFIAFHFVNAGILLSLPHDLLNGSIFYLPTWLFFVALASVAWFRQITNREYYVLAVVLFSIAIICRTVDMEVCAFLIVGTHFVWHLLISLALYYAMLALIRTNNR